MIFRNPPKKQAAEKPSEKPKSKMKAQDAKKEKKKSPLRNLKEKRLVKQEKRARRAFLSS